MTTEAEARKAVEELAAKKVDIVKIWVDDRDGTVKKLPPAMYRANIDEAHARGLRVAAHIFYLADAKELLRQVTALPGHEFWPDDVSYTAVPERGVVGHRQVTDAYLVALAAEREGVLATMDEALAAVHPGRARLIAA